MHINQINICKVQSIAFNLIKLIHVVSIINITRFMHLVFFRLELLAQNIRALRYCTYSNLKVAILTEIHLALVVYM